MNSLFEDLKKGLEEAITYEKGTCRVHAGTRIALQEEKYNEEEMRGNGLSGNEFSIFR